MIVSLLLLFFRPEIHLSYTSSLYIKL